MHEQGLAGLNVQGVDDGLVGGQSCQREACCLGEAHGAGLADEDAYIGGDQLGHAAMGTLHVAAYVPDDLASRGDHDLSIRYYVPYRIRRRQVRHQTHLDIRGVR